MPQTCSGPVAEGGDPMANCPQTHDPQGCPITAGPPPELPAGTECPVCPEPTPCPEGQMPCTSPAPPVKMCTDPATGCWPLSCPVQTCVDAFGKRLVNNTKFQNKLKFAFGFQFYLQSQ